MTDDEGMKFAFTGNTTFTDRPSAFKDAPFLKMLEILRSSDASFTNPEMAIQNGEDWPAYVAGNGRAASYLVGPPLVVEELKWMGINMLYAANNHSSNFSENGILTTIKYLNAGGMAFAGLGANLSEATAPGYLQTAKGRVALVAACDWGPRGLADLSFQMPMGIMAGDGDAFFKGRPGLNLIRYDVINTVDRQALDNLRRISQQLHWEDAKDARRKGGARGEPLLTPMVLRQEQDNDTEFHFMGRKFVLGDKWDFRTEAYPVDLERNYRWIREARRNADWVVASYHDQGARRATDEEHVKTFAHGAIDAGADIFVAQGSTHRGVEIYKGKVIIHGQPVFYFQNEGVRKAPPDLKTRYGMSPDTMGQEFVEARAAAEKEAGGATAGVRGAGGQESRAARASAIHQVVYNAKRELQEIRIYPLQSIDIGPPSVRGKVVLAAPGSPAAEAVLKKAVSESSVHGLKVDIKDGIGVIRV